jgi:hypothetical protein
MNRKGRISMDKSIFPNEPKGPKWLQELDCDALVKLIQKVWVKKSELSVRLAK